MLRQILASAVIAGALAGIQVSGLQEIRVVPLILEAETYESAGEAANDAISAAPAPHHHDMPAPTHHHVEDIATTGSWAPEEGLERTFYTVLSNILTATAFALLLTSCYALAGHVDWRRGMLWGLAGFAVFHLAPSLGLPPEVPGSTAAPLYDRHAWWFGTGRPRLGAWYCWSFTAKTCSSCWAPPCWCCPISSEHPIPSSTVAWRLRN